MANHSVTEERNSARQTTVAVPVSSAVDGEMTRGVRVIGVVIACLVAGAVLAGIWKASAGLQSGRAALVAGLFLTEVILAGILILLGSIVEGFGYGLSLGTRWPYTRNILVLMIEGDPEAAHRLVATLVGLIGIALVVLAPSSATINGLALVIIAGVFGIGTLHVLAGRMPAFVHGMHGLLAYGVFLSYLTGLAFPGVQFWFYLKFTIALHALLLTVFLAARIRPAPWGFLSTPAARALDCGGAYRCRAHDRGHAGLAHARLSSSLLSCRGTDRSGLPALPGRKSQAAKSGDDCGLSPIHGASYYCGHRRLTTMVMGHYSNKDT